MHLMHSSCNASAVSLLLARHSSLPAGCPLALPACPADGCPPFRPPLPQRPARDQEGTGGDGQRSDEQLHCKQGHVGHPGLVPLPGSHPGVPAWQLRPHSTAASLNCGLTQLRPLGVRAAQLLHCCTGFTLCLSGTLPALVSGRPSCGECASSWRWLGSMTQSLRLHAPALPQ
jgi:hypothetical protein